MTQTASQDYVVTGFGSSADAARADAERNATAYARQSDLYTRTDLEPVLVGEAYRAEIRFTDREPATREERRKRRVGREKTARKASSAGPAHPFEITKDLGSLDDTLL